MHDAGLLNAFHYSLLQFQLALNGKAGTRVPIIAMVSGRFGNASICDARRAASAGLGRAETPLSNSERDKKKSHVVGT